MIETRIPVKSVNLGVTAGEQAGAQLTLGPLTQREAAALAAVLSNQPRASIWVVVEQSGGRRAAADDDAYIEQGKIAIDICTLVNESPELRSILGVRPGDNIMPALKAWLVARRGL